MTFLKHFNSSEVLTWCDSEISFGYLFEPLKVIKKDRIFFFFDLDVYYHKLHFAYFVAFSSSGIARMHNLQHKNQISMYGRGNNFYSGDQAVILVHEDE